ncbi:DUF3137 domain-containing protein [Histidinibacterium lentulum]|uniref:DUF3137 domain-containing protein n=1 Tax=Histidinibacterium lentulum TaxID=2480588 RepID=A0A3N2QRW6_9RHOB|nr:DUF3137 domain-containing protein [Histidinibacterium lentulum]ROT97755.1 DUF3137 domain-containing protein [Histidinibacterium lentulum]
MPFVERSAIERGFAPIFDAQIAPRIDALEAERREAVQTGNRKVKIATAVGLVAGIALSLIFGNWVLLLVFGLAGLIVGFVLRGLGADRWLRKLHEVVIPPVVSFVCHLEYTREPSTGFPLGAMGDLGLFGSYNRKSLTHHLSGTWRDTSFEMVQAHLRRRSSGGSNSSGTTRTIFMGLLFSIEVPGGAPTPILIARDYGKVGNQLAGFFSFGKRRGMPRVAFEHHRFEELFEVHAEDPEAARAFMPDAFLDTLISIGDTEGGKEGAKSMTAGFEGERFFLALSRELGFMQVGHVDRSILDIEDALHALFDDLTLIRRIIDRLHGEQPVDAQGQMI